MLTIARVVAYIERETCLLNAEILVISKEDQCGLLGDWLNKKGLCVVNDIVIFLLLLESFNKSVP